MLPFQISSKIGKYDLEIDRGVNVKVNLVDHATLVDTQVSELRKCLVGKPVVGFDLKTSGPYCNPDLLILFVKDRCLIIQLKRLPTASYCLKEFMADKSICFLGTKTTDKASRLMGSSIVERWLPCTTAVEVGEMAARAMKKPNMSKLGLKELAREFGCSEPSFLHSQNIDWTAITFTHEQIKYAIQEAYTSYVIGAKLLDILG